MRVDNLKRWADGKYGLLTMYAQQVAVSAPECFQLCKLVEADDLFGFVQENVPPKVWLRYYRSRLKTQAKAIIGYVEENPLPEEFKERHEAAREAWTQKDGRVMIGAKKNAEVERRLWETVESWHYEQLECEGTAELAGNIFEVIPKQFLCSG